MTTKARYRIEESFASNGDPEYTLSIQNVHLKDEGNYTCEVPEGHKDKVQLFVTSEFIYLIAFSEVISYSHHADRFSS